MSDKPIKVLAAVMRPAGVEPEDFRARWRQHADFAMSLPLWRNVLGYSQCDAIDAERAGFTGTALDPMLRAGYAGISIMRFAALDALTRFREDPSHERLLEDTRELLGEDFDARYLVAGTETMFDRGETSSLKFIGFLRRNEELSRREFLSRWHEFALTIYLPNESAKMPLYYIQNQGLLADDQFVKAGFDGAWEQGLRDVDHLREYIHFPATSGEVLPHETFIDHAHSIFMAVDETVLYEGRG
jgi:hypothetical protein